MKIYIKIFIFCLLISVALPNKIFSQEEYAQWKTIDTGFGLAFHCAAEDSSGNIWFGSTNGSVRLSEGKFTQIDYPSYQINSILVDTSAEIWFGTNKGLYVFDGAKFQLIENNYLNQNVRIKHLALDKDGSIWISTGVGLRHFKNNEYLIYTGEKPWEGLSDGETFGLFVDSIGNKWIGSNSLFKTYSIVKYDNANWLGFNRDQGFFAALAVAFTEDSEKKMWICGQGDYDNDGIYLYDGSIIQKAGPYFQPDHCNIDNEGYLWFAGYGIILLDKGNWTHFTKENSNLCHDWYQYIFIDSKGNRWFCGSDFEGRTLSLLTPGKVQPFTTGIEKQFNGDNNKDTKIHISPNPSNLQSKIEYYIPESGKVSIDIYNILGQKVKALVSETEKPKGYYSVSWFGMDDSGKTAPSGVYFCLYTFKNRRKVVKFTVLK